MPRYKVKCGCGQVFWCKKRIKLDVPAKQMLRGSICTDCSDIYRRRFQMVKSGVFQVLPDERNEVEKLIDRLKNNLPWGFGQTPFRDYFKKTVAEDRKTVAEGITTRYRGYSPVREMLRRRHRILGAEWIWGQAGLDPKEL